MIIKDFVKVFVWPRVKFLDFETQLGRVVKDFVRKELGMKEQRFENECWKITGKEGARFIIHNALRQQRAYVLQQMKFEYYGE